MKKIIIGIILVLAIIGLTGCEKKEKVVISGEKVNTSKMLHKHCTREGDAGTGIEVELNYEIYYTGDILNLLESEEKIITASEEKLTEYENAYKKIHEHYKGLKYYDAEVTRTETTVTSKISINYDKINISRLLDIEGAEDNIIENGVAKVDKWLELAKKFGTKCELVEE